MGGIVFVLVAATIVTIVISVSITRRRRRDAQLYQHWQAMRARQQTWPEAHLARVSVVYQRARSGTKAIIDWSGTGIRQDSWFESFWPPAGAIVLVSGSTGWGPHNRNPDVFYIESGDVLYMLPPNTFDAVERHKMRLNK